MSKLLLTRLELGAITDGDDIPVSEEGVIFFEGIHDSPEIIYIKAPDAAKIAARIVELWNAALSRC